MKYGHVKRAIDIAVSGTALLLLAPLLLLVAVLIKMETTGFPLFFQDRVGQGGRVFRMVKFRSMVKDAPSLGNWYTGHNDPRITRMGHFIRTTSIDELPQLWNVLTGDMSLVGPRPETPFQESLYGPVDWHIRHRVRPGITGLAQVKGRSSLNPEARLRYDLDYASQPTFAKDIRILLATVAQVLRKTGVN